MSAPNVRHSRKRAAAAFAVVVLAASAAMPSQEVTDGDLERSSAGRTVRLRTGANGGGALVDMPVELYVARVLAGEGEPRAAAAAQQALAIAIRTFAAANAGRHGRDGFDLCATTHCQVLRPSTPASRAAALATASQLLTYEGKPATVFYSASCGGRSEAASQMWSGATNLPYLRSSEDDAHPADESWMLEVPVARVEQTLRRIGFEGKRLRDLEVERRNGSGRVTMLRLSGLRPDSITGEDLRAAIGARELRSTRFTVKKHRSILRFTGRGYGHGVGFCVVGAGRRAARGETTLQILQQYYPGVRVELLPAAARAAVDANVRDRTPAHDLVRRARSELAAVLGIAAPPEVRLEVHPSLATFHSATGRPWWVAFAVTGATIDLAPLASLDQTDDGVEGAVRRAVAEVLTGDALAAEPAWVRVGAARYYATTPRIELSTRRVKCPTDAELAMPVSAASHRDAELRAEACFAHALTATGNWRNVR